MKSDAIIQHFLNQAGQPCVSIAYNRKLMIMTFEEYKKKIEVENASNKR